MTAKWVKNGDAWEIIGGRWFIACVYPSSVKWIWQISACGLGADGAASTEAGALAAAEAEMRSIMLVTRGLTNALADALGDPPPEGQAEKD